MRTMAFQIPRPCPYDKTLMDRVGEGVKCPQCGHQIFDPIFTAETQPVCTCANCAEQS
jgi:hypothetical protein